MPAMSTMHSSDGKHDVYYMEDVSQNHSSAEDGPEREEKRIANAEHHHQVIKDAPMTKSRMMSLVAMAFLWTGSQIPVYLFGGVPPYIYGDIGGADRWTWFVIGNLLALAAVCPFVGSLSDLFGRRWVSIGGAMFLIVGNIVAGTAKSMNVFIVGMALNGVGAGVNELTALAVTSEIAPVSKRGLYNGLMVLTILPFCPSVLWGQLIASTGPGNWRYVAAFCGGWAAIGLVLTFVFYHPPPRVNSEGLSRGEILKRIDYVGGILSIAGMLLFMAGLQWGGYQYPWGSAHVLAPLIIGVVLIVLFFIWESRFAKFPMFPKRLRQEPRILGLTLVITAISGANFFSVLLFWPTQSYNVYGHEPVQVGIRNITLGFSVLLGAVINLVLLSYLKGHIRALMVFSCVLMTAGCGAMAALRIDNLWLVYVVLTIAGIGIGGIVVPASIITTIICPDDIIATVTALTLAVRVLGGALAYAIYYNVFLGRFLYYAEKRYLVPIAYASLKITNVKILGAIVQLTGAGLLEELKTLPGVDTEAKYQLLVHFGQLSYAAAYPMVYYVSLAFGGVAIICSCFLGDISKYMDAEHDHIAVGM